MNATTSISLFEKPWLKRSLRRCLPERVREWGRCLLQPDYRTTVKINRELKRLRSLPRYQATSTDLFGSAFDLPDAASFVEMYGEIFSQQMYQFESGRAAPRIIDGGANIGLSVLYFKKLFPQSRIVAFEPDENISAILERNIAQAGLANVTVIRRALSDTETTLGFLTEGSYAGRIARTDDHSDQKVPTVRLRDYLSETVDMLKLNIEGAETQVLVDCADLLHRVQNIAFEYHSFAGELQSLPRLLQILEDAGFRLHIIPVRSAPRPLVEREVLLGMDMQMYVFGFRT